MRKRIVAILVAAIVLTAIAQPAWAHGREQHDADIELILFGCENYKESHSSAKDSIQALEDAVYLAVDQFNGNGAKELEQLKGMGIKGLPRSIDAFDYSSNSTHRGLTHRGWDFEYLEKAHWPIRKSILTNTVQKVLFDESTPLSWFPWLSDMLYDTTQSTKQRDSFCALLYYIHILGDHIDTEKYGQLCYIAPLARPNDEENPGIIPELQKHLGILFASQQSSFTYQALMGELDNLNARASNLLSSTGGINTDEKFTQYHKCAVDLRETLALYLPTLLEDEPFFKCFK